MFMKYYQFICVQKTAEPKNTSEWKKFRLSSILNWFQNHEKIFFEHLDCPVKLQNATFEIYHSLLTF